MIGLINMGGRAMRFLILYAFLEVVGIIISLNPRVGISLSVQTCSSNHDIIVEL